MKRIAVAVFLMLVLAGLTAGSEPFASQDLTLSGPAGTLELQSAPFELRLTSPAGKPVLTLVGGPSFTVVRDKKAHFTAGDPANLTSGVGGPSFSGVGNAQDIFTGGKADPWTTAGVVTNPTRGEDFIEWEMAAGPNDAPVRMRATLASPHSVRISCETNRPEVNRLTLRLARDKNERYFGMGERPQSAEHSGERLYNWAEEQYIGSGRLAKTHPLPLTRLNTYFPVPFYLNPIRGYGLLLDDTHLSEFDFGKEDPSTVAITNWNDRMDLMIFTGDNPLDVITNYTEFAGRITPAPPWAFGVWNAAADKQGRVREVARVTREHRIPTSGIWSEDWAWHDVYRFYGSKKSQWELNRNRYPDYEALAADLHRDGFKFFSYFHPYIGYKSDAAREAQARGYLAQTASGGPYVFSFMVTQVVQPDLTRPEASRWWQDRFFKPAAAYGVDGWMHDFAEYVPAEARFGNGQDGWAVHNAYPVLWAKAGREFWERERPDGDWVFWMRSGYTGSWKYAPVMWTGDQNMDWERYDGIPSVIPSVTSVGISGSAVTSTDIAGYHCIPVVDSPTDKELFFRWTQIGAMLPVMRIHESSGCPIIGGLQRDNWLFDTDAETLALWKKYTSLHTSLFPYFYTLVHEAARTGWPVVRHLMLHYPNDPGSLAEEYEFLVGDRLLVAPVIVDGAREREVYFPPGEWVDFWNGQHFTGPAKIKVPAPLEVIPLFVKAGTMIPTFDGQIDTLVKEDRADLNGWDDANKSVKVLFFGEGRDQLRLWDGTEIACDSGQARCEVTGGGPRRDYSWNFRK